MKSVLVVLALLVVALNPPYACARTERSVFTVVKVLPCTPGNGDWLLPTNPYTRVVLNNKRAIELNTCSVTEGDKVTCSINNSGEPQYCQLVR